MGCTASLNQAPTDCVCPNVPLPTNPQNSTYCFGAAPNSLSVDNTAAYTVNWYATAVGGSSLQVGNSFTPSAAGTFYAELTDNVNQCVGERIPVVLSQNAELIINQNNSSCSSDLSTYSVEISLTGGTSPYTVASNMGNLTDNGNNSYTISNIASATAPTISVTDDNACAASAILNAVNCNCPPISPPTNPNGSLVCFEQPLGLISVDAAPANYVVQWYDSPTGGVLVAEGNTFVPTTPDTYYAQLIDPNTNCVSSRIAVVAAIGTEHILAQGNSSCSADLSTYGTTFSVSNFSNGSLIVSDNSGSIYVVEDLGNGNYNVSNILLNSITTATFTDDDDCSTDLVLTVPVCDCPFVPTPTVVDNNLTYCAGSPIPAFEVNISAGYSAIWIDSNGTIVGNGSTFVAPQAGDYAVYLSNNTNNCAGDTVDVSVNENALLTIGTMAGNCASDLLSYSIDVVVLGGTAPYQLSNDVGTVVDNGNGSFEVTNIPTNQTANLLATDALGCEQSGVGVLMNCGCGAIDLPDIVATDLQYCFGEAIPSFTAQNVAVGFSIHWFDNNGNEVGIGNTFTPSSSGIYAVQLIETISACGSELLPLSVTENTAILITENDFSCSTDL
ncbi:MAG TPA: hypothetical protein PK230_09550, partial [Chitinophagales bacterium]|nr:hypothetical protein [Chitinophagales bacterium]